MGLRNELGKYNSLGALWAAHPEGGREGDVATIGETEYRWDKYVRVWVPVEGSSPDGGASGGRVDGDLSVGGNLSVGGDATVQGELTVGSLRMLNTRKSYRLVLSGNLVVREGNTYTPSQITVAVQVTDGETTEFKTPSQLSGGVVRVRYVNGAYQAGFSELLTQMPSFSSVNKCFSVLLVDFSDSANPVVLEAATVGIVKNGGNGTNGTNGADGKGIASVTTYYLVSTLSSGVEFDEQTWSQSYVLPDSDHPYLWRCTVYTYTEGEPYVSPCELILTYTDPRSRFPRIAEWTAGEAVFAGTPGERWIDMRIVDGVYYLCIQSHTTSSSTMPGTTGGADYWVSGGDYSFISTNMLLAQEALIKYLVATRVRTGDTGFPHVEMEDGRVQFYGKYTFPSIVLETDDDDVGILRFYNKSGQLVKTIGPDGVQGVTATDAGFSHVRKYIAATSGAPGYRSNAETPATDMFVFTAKRSSGNIVGDSTYTASSDETAAAADGKYYYNNTALASNTLVTGRWRDVGEKIKELKYVGKFADNDEIKAYLVECGVSSDSFSGLDFTRTVDGNRLASPIKWLVYTDFDAGVPSLVTDCWQDGALG